MKLKGKNVLLTGGSWGIGPVVAAALARSGASLALVARSGGPLEEVVASLRAAGARAGALPADLGDAAERERLVERAERELHGTGVGFTTVYPGYVTEEGMFARSGLRPPRLVGSATPHQVARAVARGIRRERPDVVVNSLPLRPLLALADVAPAAGDRVLRWIGVAGFQRRKAEASAARAGS